MGLLISKDRMMWLGHRAPSLSSISQWISFGYVSRDEIQKGEPIFYLRDYPVSISVLKAGRVKPMAEPIRDAVGLLWPFEFDYPFLLKLLEVSEKLEKAPKPTIRRASQIAREESSLREFIERMGRIPLTKEEWNSALRARIEDYMSRQSFRIIVPLSWANEVEMNISGNQIQLKFKSSREGTLLQMEGEIRTKRDRKSLAVYAARFTLEYGFKRSRFLERVINLTEVVWSKLEGVSSFSLPVGEAPITSVHFKKLGSQWRIYSPRDILFGRNIEERQVLVLFVERHISETVARKLAKKWRLAWSFLDFLLEGEFATRRHLATALWRGYLPEELAELVLMFKPQGDRCLVSVATKRGSPLSRRTLSKDSIKALLSGRIDSFLFASLFLSPSEELIKEIKEKVGEGRVKISGATCFIRGKSGRVYTINLLTGRVYYQGAHICLGREIDGVGNRILANIIALLNDEHLAERDGSFRGQVWPLSPRSAPLLEVQEAS